LEEKYLISKGKWKFWLAQEESWKPQICSDIGLLRADKSLLYAKVLCERLNPIYSIM
jgi:hypothetical protein